MSRRKLESGGTRIGDRLASDDEDLYSGFNEYPTALNTDDLEFDEGFQNSARSIAERRPGLLSGRSRALVSSSGLNTAAGYTRQGTARSGLFTRNGTARPITGVGGEVGGLNRPMTAVRGAGYTTSKNQKLFDPLNQGIKSATPSLEIKLDDSPESKIKLLEEKISILIEESVLANCEKNYRKALEHAKEAQQKERSLMKLREQAGLAEGHDWDISFSVLFNLASQYESCDMYTEALSTYQSITKNKFLTHGCKVKINMGNIYLKQNLPTKAIKMYRMAMDQLANTNRDLRLKLMHNMGIVFLRINHSEDAAASFEYIMTEHPSFKTGLHLVVANFMTGDPEKTKRSFQELLQVPLDMDEDEEKYSALSDDPVSQLLVEVLKKDKLRKLEKEKKTYAERCVLSAARLIAPIVESNFTEGYHWVTEAIKSSRHASLAHALEISKALVFLKQRELGEAIEILKSFEKKETKVATAAATNLSFLFFLQGDLNQAEKYGEAAKEADYYNSSAFVNLGNCLFARGDIERAKQLYLEAIAIDSSCVEALYNLGLISQKLKFYEEALDFFHKAVILIRNHPHLMYQIGRTHELMQEIDVGMEWYLKALAITPTDAGILKRIGQLYELDGDKRKAYQYYYDCYKSNPSDINVVEWVASYLMNDVHLPERAVMFFEHGQKLQPEDPNWLNSIAACHRKNGNYKLATEVYQNVYKQFPDNVHALQQLIKLANSMGTKEAKFYEEELKKLEKRLQSRTSSSRSDSGRISRIDRRNGTMRKSGSRSLKSVEPGHNDNLEIPLNDFGSSSANSLRDRVKSREEKRKSESASSFQEFNRKIDSDDEAEDLFKDDILPDDLLPY